MSYNTNHYSVKRILREIKEIQNSNDPDLTAAPLNVWKTFIFIWSLIFLYLPFLKDDIFEWHFTVRGPPDSEFEDGIYHGRLLLPTDYPLKPPDFIMLTVSFSEKNIMSPSFANVFINGFIKL